jgi:hypothetical protein
MTDHAKLRQLATRATPGPWEAQVWIETDGNEWRATGPGHEEHASDSGSEPGSPDEQAAQRDAAFIAAANPSAVIALLDQLAAMTRARDAACDLAKSIAWKLHRECPNDMDTEEHPTWIRILDDLRNVGAK